MKKAGLVVLIIGIAITVFTSFNTVSKEKVVDIGNLEITRDKDHTMEWSPFAGTAAMVIGAGVLLFSARRK